MEGLEPGIIFEWDFSRIYSEFILIDSKMGKESE